MGPQPRGGPPALKGRDHGCPGWTSCKVSTLSPAPTTCAPAPFAWTSTLPSCPAEPRPFHATLLLHPEALHLQGQVTGGHGGRDRGHSREGMGERPLPKKSRGPERSQRLRVTSLCLKSVGPFVCLTSFLNPGFSCWPQSGSVEVSACS